MRRAEHVSGLPEADELLEILSHELAAAVGNDAGPCSGKGLPPALQDDLRVGLLHCPAHIPGHNETRKKVIQHRAEIVVVSREKSLAKTGSRVL